MDRSSFLYKDLKVRYHKQASKQATPTIYVVLSLFLFNNGGGHANRCSSFFQERGGTVCGDDGAFVFIWMREESEEDLISPQRYVSRIITS